MEDVRKLAKKFVSESLAEQIADFIARVTSTGVNPNVSEENEKNEELFEQISEEDALRNNKAARQRMPKKIEPKKLLRTKTTKYLEITTERYRSPNNMYQNKRFKQIQSKTVKTTKKQNFKYLEKQYRSTDDQHNLNNKIENVNTEPVTKEKHHPDTSQSEEVEEADPLQVIEATENATEQPQKPQKKQESAQDYDHNPESTIGYAEKYDEKSEFDDNPNPSRHRLTQFGSAEMNETFDLSKLYENTAENTIETTPRSKAFNIARAPEELTTEKERNEFDQYENVQYPKSEFIATSGPVALPKMPSRSQSQNFDKAKPDFQKSRKNSKSKSKAWF